MARSIQPHPRVVLFTLLLPWLLGGAALVAQKPHPVMSAFEPTGEYRLMVDGEEVNAEVYLSRRAAAVLVVSPTLERPLLVWARSARVDAISPESLLRANGKIDLAETVERDYLGDYRPGEAGLELPLDGRHVRLAPKAALVGDATFDELLEHSPEYAAGASSYSPNAEALAALRGSNASLELQVFFGSWCGVCKTYLPHLLRVARELDGAAIRFTYYGVDYPPGGWRDPRLERQRVTALPTAIVLKNGKEIGRLVGADGFAHPEEKLAGLLAAN